MTCGPSRLRQNHPRLRSSSPSQAQRLNVSDALTLLFTASLSLLMPAAGHTGRRGQVAGWSWSWLGVSRAMLELQCNALDVGAAAGAELGRRGGIGASLDRSVGMVVGSGWFYSSCWWR